jgi:hypothetical protein
MDFWPAAGTAPPAPGIVGFGILIAPLIKTGYNPENMPIVLDANQKQDIIQK